MKRGKYDLALADLTRAIQLQPDLAEAFHYRGYVYLNVQKDDAAIADYNQAIKLDPGNSNALFGRGFDFYRSGKYDQAIADYDQVLKFGPEPRALLNRGSAYFRRGEFDLAISDYDARFRLEPKSAHSLYGRGYAKQKKGDDAGPKRRAGVTQIHGIERRVPAPLHG